jgi:hypothetical protein
MKSLARDVMTTEAVTVEPWTPSTSTTATSACPMAYPLDAPHEPDDTKAVI